MLTMLPMPAETVCCPYRSTLKAVAALSLIVRVAAALALDGLWHPEVWEYNAIARNMLDGAGFSYSHHGVVYYSFSPPLFPWISAASYWCFGSIAPVMSLQIAAGVALTVVAVEITRRLFGGWVAPAATGVLVALHPGLVLYCAAKAHPLTFDALFFSLVLLQTLRLHERLTTGRAVGLGLLVGVGALSRATLVVFLPVAAAWLLAVSPRRSRVAAAGLLVVAAVVATAAIAPWTIRNSRLHRRFVFMVTTDAEAFWRGNNALATGHSYVDADRLVVTALPPAELESLRRQPDELAQAEWFSTRARTFVREQPAAFARLTALKFFYFWWFAPQTGVRYPSLWLSLYRAYYFVAVLLALLGLREVVRAGPPSTYTAILMVAFLIALSGLQSLYYVEGRHRWAVEPVLLVLSGGGLAAVAATAGRLWRRHRTIT